LTSRTILRKASMNSLRFGTGISSPFGVFCVGSGATAPPSLSQSSCSGSCCLPLIHGEVSAPRLPQFRTEDRRFLRSTVRVCASCASERAVLSGQDPAVPLASYSDAVSGLSG
jgi:hypothetical protein